jgi:hypothetical protein
MLLPVSLNKLRLTHLATKRVLPLWVGERLRPEMEL